MNRVVVTGYGMITPVGLTATDTWQAIVAGRSGIGPITLFDTSNQAAHIAAEVKDFDPHNFLDHRSVRRQDRFQWFANAAASEALEHSGLEITEEGSYRIGVAICSGVGGLGSMEESVLTVHTDGPSRLSPFAIPKIMANGASGTVSIKFGLRGPSFSVGSACASAADGIGFSVHLLRAGTVDVMLAGGSEAGITPVGIASFTSIRAYSQRTEHTPAPFSADRDGLIMGEGAAVMVFETLEHARARGADILAELVGYGATSDAYHVTAPLEDGSGSAKAIQNALADARCAPDDIDYINAHGTGTTLNDAAETKAIKLALGDKAYKIPISSTKSMTGHLMSATGALEALLCILSIRNNIAPPTINYREVDPECDLDYVPNAAREVPIRVAITNSFGFGGHNSVLVFRAFED